MPAGGLEAYKKTCAPPTSLAILCTRGPDVIRKEAWSFYRRNSGIRLCWELEDPKGPAGLCIIADYLLAFRRKQDAATYFQGALNMLTHKVNLGAAHALHYHPNREHLERSQLPLPKRWLKRRPEAGLDCLIFAKLAGYQSFEGDACSCVRMTCVHTVEYEGFVPPQFQGVS